MGAATAKIAMARATTEGPRKPKSTSVLVGSTPWLIAPSRIIDVTDGARTISATRASEMHLPVLDLQVHRLGAVEGRLQVGQVAPVPQELDPVAVVGEADAVAALGGGQPRL